MNFNFTNADQNNQKKPPQTFQSNQQNEISTSHYQSWILNQDTSTAPRPYQNYQQNPIPGLKILPLSEGMRKEINKLNESQISSISQTSRLQPQTSTHHSVQQPEYSSIREEAASSISSSSISKPSPSIHSQGSETHYLSLGGPNAQDLGEPLILEYEKNGMRHYLIDTEPLIASLCGEAGLNCPNTPLKDVIRNRLNRPCFTAVDVVYVCDNIGSTYTWKIKKISYTKLEDKGKIEVESKETEFLCINSSCAGTYSRQGGKDGKKFITKEAWDKVKTKGDFGKVKFCEEKINKFENYFRYWTQRTPTPRKKSSDISQVPSGYALMGYESGKFGFNKIAEGDFDQNDKKFTPLDAEIIEFSERRASLDFIEFLQDINDFSFSWKEIGLKSFAATLSIAIAKGCHKVFLPYLCKTEEVAARQFIMVSEVPGIPGDIPDLSISLLHKTSNLHIPVLLQEEKYNITKADHCAPQITSYCQKYLRINYPFINCVIYSQNSMQVRLVRFNKKTSNSLDFDSLVSYTHRFSLLKENSQTINPKAVKTFLRTILKTIYFQLEALGKISQATVALKKMGREI